MSTASKPRPFKFEWQQRLQDLKDAFHRNEFPHFAKDNGPMRGKWNDETANGLTKAIVDYLRYLGGNFTRVNVMGTPRKDRFGKLIFTPSTTKRGTADIVGVFKGRYIAIEVKIGPDRQSKDQIQEQKDVTNAGGIYLIARDMQNFISDFTSMFPNT
jgi:hypothetical protein